MRAVTNVILAIYNFFVGDPVILIGVALSFLVIGLLAHSVGAPAAVTGALLVVGVLISVSLALWREVHPAKH